MNWKILVCGCVTTILFFNFIGCRSDTPAVEAVPSVTPSSNTLVDTTVFPSVVPTPAPTPDPINIMGQYYPADAEDISIYTPIDKADILSSTIDSFSNLKRISLVRELPNAFFSEWASEWEALTSSHPDIDFIMSDYWHDMSAEEVEAFSLTELTDHPIDEANTVLQLFPNVKLIDIQETLIERKTMAALTMEFPSVQFCWLDSVFGNSDSMAETLSFSNGSDINEINSYLSCFKHVKEVDLLLAELSEQEESFLCDTYPQIAFHRTVTLNGRKYDSFIESLNLESANISDYSIFYNTLAYFPKLTSTEMHYCSLTDSQLAALRSRYPEKGIVWTVHVHGRNIRTDIIAYSSKQYSNNTNRFVSKDCSAFRYCNKLIALDLGHNAITDISWIKFLPNLQLLILSDNKVSNLSPLSDLKNLKYVELFMNPISDISPLGELPELLDVNLCFDRVSDITPLLNCKKLERIWLSGNRSLNEDDLQTLSNAFPNAIISYDPTATGSTSNGWRNHPRYNTYVEMFQKNIAIDPFLPEE